MIFSTQKMTDQTEKGVGAGSCSLLHHHLTRQCRALAVHISREVFSCAKWEVRLKISGVQFSIIKILWFNERPCLEPAPAAFWITHRSPSWLQSSLSRLHDYAKQRMGNLAAFPVQSKDLTISDEWMRPKLHFEKFSFRFTSKTIEITKI